MCKCYNLPFEEVIEVFRKNPFKWSAQDKNLIERLPLSDLDERFKLVVRKICQISPSCFLTLFEFDEKHILHYEDVVRLFRLLMIEKIPVGVSPEFKVADLIQRELGILLYSSLREDLATGVLDVSMVKEVIDECGRNINKLMGDVVKINGRKKLF